MKSIREESEGTAVLLDDPCSFDSHFGHCTRAWPKSSWVHKVLHMAKIPSCENLSAYKTGGRGRGVCKSSTEIGVYIITCIFSYNCNC